MSRLCLMSLALPCLAMLGCGGSKDPKMAAVSGRITLKGKPLANAEVHFVSGQFQGFGKTDDEGRYSLVRGAPIGVNKVYVVPADSNQPATGIDTSIEGMDAGQLAEMQKHSRGRGRGARSKKPLIPVEYSDPAKSKLTFEVPAGGSKNADFSL